MSLAGHGGACIRIPVQRHRQLPSCEWHCRRAGSLLRSASYTFERLDHWFALARQMPGQVAELYRVTLDRPEIPGDGFIRRSDVYRRVGELCPRFPRGLPRGVQAGVGGATSMSSSITRSMKSPTSCFSAPREGRSITMAM